MGTSALHFRPTRRHCGGLLRLRPRVLGHTPLICVTSLLRVAPRALDHIHSTDLGKWMGSFIRVGEGNFI